MKVGGIEQSDRLEVGGDLHDLVVGPTEARLLIGGLINDGGGSIDDEPTVTLETPPDPDRVSSFLNIRVADIQAVYAEWSARAAQFVTPKSTKPRFTATSVIPTAT